MGRNKGLRSDGTTRYGLYCDHHHRLRGDGPYYKKKIQNRYCEICGWDKACCNRYLIDKKQGFARGNVITLCPNCHRLALYGVIKTIDLVKVIYDNAGWWGGKNTYT